MLDIIKHKDFINKYNINLDFNNWLESYGKKIFEKLGVVKIHITKGSGKLIDFKSINTNTLTNPFCKKENASNNKEKICTDCYSVALLEGLRKNMQECLERNSKLLSESILPDSLLPIFLDRFIRIDSHGEIINMTHLINIMNIIEKNPSVIFGFWSKRTDLIFPYFKLFPKPKNVIMIYSNPKKNHIMNKIPKYFDKVFNNVYKDNYIDEQNCTGQKCRDCLKCYQFDTTNKIVEKVKKY